MKITVLVNSKNLVVGTARNNPFEPGIEVGLLPAKGQSVHVLEVPDELARLPSSDLHKKLQKFLPKQRKKSDKE
jgi:hypothetical protein